MLHLLLFLVNIACILAQKRNINPRNLEVVRWKLNVSEVWVINLDRRPERMKVVSKQLIDLRIPYQRFSAIDFGDGNNETIIKEAVSRLHRTTRIKIDQVKKALAQSNRTDFTWGSVGCWQSHLQLYIQIGLNYSPSLGGPVVILEDDLDISPHIVKVLSRKFLNTILPNDWEMLYLTHDGLKCFLDEEDSARLAKDRVVEFQFCQVKYVWQTAAYVLRNRDVARKLTFFSNTPHAQVADWFLNERFHKKEIVAYALLYMAARQRRETFCSDINPSSQCVKYRSQT